MGRVINIEQTIAEAERKRKEGPPMPTVVRKKDRKEPLSDTYNNAGIASQMVIPEFAIIFEPSKSSPKDAILDDLWQQVSELKTERAKLSTTIAMRVDEGATKDYLKDLYAQINHYTMPLQRLWNQIKFVELHGELPQRKAEQSPSQAMELLTLRERKRSLINTRNKLKKNLKPNAKKPLNSDRVIHWQEQLALQDAEYEEIRLRITQLENDTKERTNN